MLLDSFLRRAAEDHPDKAALVRGEGRVSYGELQAGASSLAAALAAAGVRPGGRVAIQLDDGAEAVMAAFAALEAGAAFVLVSPTAGADRLAAIMRDCAACAVVTDASRRPAGDTPHLLASGHGAAGASWSPPRRLDTDLAALIYTSGSTGRPKGVMLTHRNLVAACDSITAYLELAPSDVILSVLPPSFGYGLSQILTAFQVGATVVLERSFAFPEVVLRALTRERATGLPLVPTVAALLLRMDLSRHDLSSLRYVTNAAAALPVDHVRRLRALLPHAAFYSMYGLTECIRVSYLAPGEVDARPGSVGKAMANVEARVAGPDGRQLPPGEVGELVVRGPNVMLGYWGDPEGTARRLRPGTLPGQRVLHTGDLFRADAEGYLYFVGREDDVIKCRGEKVSPREVEDVLHAHPAVAEAAVIGVDDPILGQAVRAFVVPRAGTPVTPMELRRHCAERLESFMVPGEVEVLPGLPKLDSGKVDRQRLKGGEG